MSTFTGELDLFGAMRNRRKSDSATPELDAVDQAYGTWKKTGTPSDLASVVKSLAPTIDSALTSYGGGNRALAGKAKLMAVNAVKSFTPDKDTKLKSWVHSNLQGLQRAGHKLTPFTVPERMTLDNAKIWQAAKSFEEENGRQPDALEISDLTGLSIKRINRAKNAVRPVVAEGQFVAKAEASDDEDALFLPATQFTPEDEVWAEAVYRDLDVQGRALWDMSLGRGDYKGKSLSTSEMAAVLGASPSVVSQRLGAIQRKLNQVGV